jgi:outer membrane usher protein
MEKLNGQYNEESYFRGFFTFRLALLVTCQIAMLMSGAELAHAAGYFNPALLEIDNPDQGNADLSIFEEGALQPPGIYRVDIYLNGSEVDTREVKFALTTDASGKQSLQPCLSGEQLRDMGVKWHVPRYSGYRRMCQFHRRDSSVLSQFPL